jgi:hypothetical protein
VECMIEIFRDHATRVKRWASGEMALRWAAAGMLAAESQFRRVKGYRELLQLAAALECATAEEPDLLDLPARCGRLIAGLSSRPLDPMASGTSSTVNVSRIDRGLTVGY